MKILTLFEPKHKNFKCLLKIEGSLKKFLNIKCLMPIPSPLQQYHFHVILIWWHSLFNSQGWALNLRQQGGWKNKLCILYTTVATTHINMKGFACFLREECPNRRLTVRSAVQLCPVCNHAVRGLKATFSCTLFTECWVREGESPRVLDCNLMGKNCANYVATLYHGRQNQLKTVFAELPKPRIISSSSFYPMEKTYCTYI